jgi:hypothetical protein
MEAVRFSETVEQTFSARRKNPESDSHHCEELMASKY